MTRLFWEEAARHLSGLIKVIMGIFSTFNLAGTRQGQSCPQGNLGQGSTTERPRAECSADRVSAGLGFQSGPRGNVSGRQRTLGGSRRRSLTRTPPGVHPAAVAVVAEMTGREMDNES